MTSRLLGAVATADGVDFRVDAPAATAVFVCLFSSDDPGRERGRLELTRGEDGVWRGQAAGEGPGLLYGLRADGPRDPARGLFFDPGKLLIDPRAGAVAGDPVWHPALLTANHGDSAAAIPRSVVVDPDFDWDGVRRPDTAWERTLLYECHVRGMTRRHPEVPEPLRGTYLGLVEPPVLDHLSALGVTTLELMPVAHFAAEPHLAESGRPNYWGYSPIAFFAPYSGYASSTLGGDRPGHQVAEFKTMVRELHRAGIEVILDLVLNHTAEIGIGGTTLGPRGLDNAGFYRLDPEDPSLFVDYTGCGNTIDVGNLVTRQLLLDSLRYWAEEMRVDGFRLDLAAVLGRDERSFSPTAAFFREVAGDPILSRRKLVAEPWDLGPDGYQAGSFPQPWREWNDRYRDAARAFWRGDAGAAPRLATRLAGSSDLYSGRSSAAATGVNYVACHDGFTLADVVSYSKKHNEANGEDGRDGRSDNLSHNWGVEGPTTDPSVLGLRRRTQKNLLATLALSAGVPMLGHGDEMGRTQGGNNNAYCHDSELTWVDWDLDPERRDLLDFARRAFELRRRLEVFGQRRFFTPAELRWRDSSGRELAAEDWRDGGRRALVAVHRHAGEPRLAIVLNASPGLRSFSLPAAPAGTRWRARLTTGESSDRGGDRFDLGAYSLVALVAEDDSSSDSSTR